MTGAPARTGWVRPGWIEWLRFTRGGVVLVVSTSSSKWRGMGVCASAVPLGLSAKGSPCLGYSTAWLGSGEMGERSASNTQRWRQFVQVVVVGLGKQGR